jgi:sulfatase modifying factor 1
MNPSETSSLALTINESRALTIRMDRRLALVERLLSKNELLHDPKAGTNFTNRLGIQMIWCPPGELKMGNPKDKPWHGKNYREPVLTKITAGFWIASTTVTQAQWTSVFGTNPSYYTWSQQLPVEQVNWENALSFCEALNNTEFLPAGYRYTLPYEAQWEYACRAGTTGPLAGKPLSELGWNIYALAAGQHCKEHNRTHEVATKAPNPWGIFDMHGNVWEWCFDYWDAVLHGGNDPKGPQSGKKRIVRGGNAGSSPECCESPYRHYWEPARTCSGTGFRVVLSSDANREDYPTPFLPKNE